MSVFGENRGCGKFEACHFGELGYNNEEDALARFC